MAWCRVCEPMAKPLGGQRLGLVPVQNRASPSGAPTGSQRATNPPTAASSAALSCRLTSSATVAAAAARRAGPPRSMVLPSKSTWRRPARWHAQPRSSHQVVVQEEQARDQEEGRRQVEALERGRDPEVVAVAVVEGERDRPRRQAALRPGSAGPFPGGPRWRTGAGRRAGPRARVVPRPVAPGRTRSARRCASRAPAAETPSVLRQAAG